MNNLHLNLKKKWFDMIFSGEKKEEYRELSKYWGERFTKLLNFNYINDMEKYLNDPRVYIKEFDTITFSNGYAKNRRQFVIECKGIEIKAGIEKWGALPGKKYFTLKLGNIISRNFVS